MVLEYCVGGDLAQAMVSRRQEPVEEPLARGLVRQLAAGARRGRHPCGWASVGGWVGVGVGVGVSGWVGG
jgi:hypothetical protein